MNGSVTPVSGITRVTPPTITNTCSAKIALSPTASSVEKESRDDLRHVLQRVADALLEGASFSAALTRQPEAFPARRERKARPHRYGTAWWIERDGHVWLVRRPPSGLLGGMAALPGSEWTDKPPPGAAPLRTVRHVFTHFSLDLAVELCTEPVGDGWWHRIETLAEAGLPTLYRRASELALASIPKRRAAA